LEGLVHISELSWDKVGRAEDAFKAGDKVKVKVIGKTNGKLAFSIRQTQEDPWDKIEDKYKKESRVKGKISEKEEVELEGLVHISELSWDKVGRAEDAFKAGDEVKVKVIGKTNGKLAFSIRQTQVDPWDKIEDKYKKESRVKGKISKLTDFGVFVQLEPGIEGLVHLTKIPPGKSLAKGDSVNVYVEEIDPKEKRISLGLVLTEKPVGYK